MSITHSAILDSGANSTYVINRCLLDNSTSPTSHSVTVADGSIDPIVASGTLVGHPSIAADFVPSFTSNLIGLPPIIKTGVTGVMAGDKMTLIKRSPIVDKILNFVISYSHANNLIILTGKSINDLYTTTIPNKTALLSIHSHHFTSPKDMVHYFYLVFDCPHLEAYCRLV